jgi:hypothetical protein
MYSVRFRPADCAKLVITLYKGIPPGAVTKYSYCHKGFPRQLLVTVVSALTTGNCPVVLNSSISINIDVMNTRYFIL